MLELKYKYPLDHEKAKQEQLQNNLNEFLDELKGDISNETKTKISSTANLLDLSENYILYYLRTEAPFSDILASKYCKEPGRQNLNENLMRDFIEKLPIISNPRRYSTNGGDTLFICGGRVDKYRGTANNTKSIDSSWEYLFNGLVLKFYATLKYTKSSGGAQLNQVEDVKKFLNEACNVRTPNERFIAICDGALYIKPYMEKETKRRYKHRMDCIEEENRKNTVKITNTDELLWRIVDLIIEWLDEKLSTGELTDKQAVENEKERIKKIRNEFYIL